MPMYMKPGCIAGVEAYIADKIAKKTKALIELFAYCGEKCIVEARLHGTYGNRTGNLRSSIGYIIVVNGVIKKSVIVEATNGDKDGKGAASVNAQFNELASRFPRGVALVVVAGMNYAGYVEAMNLNVLISAEQLARQIVPRMLRELAA